MIRQTGGVRHRTNRQIRNNFAFPNQQPLTDYQPMIRDEPREPFINENAQEFSEDTPQPVDSAQPVVPAGLESRGGKPEYVPTVEPAAGYSEDREQFLAAQPHRRHVFREHDPATAVCRELRRRGIRVSDWRTLAELVDDAAWQYSIGRAAWCLNEVFQRLPGGRRGTELRAALLETVNCAEAARVFGVSAQSFTRGIRRLREKILKNG
jgi:hypothetical protein